MSKVNEIIPLFNSRQTVSLHFLYDYLIYYPGLLDELIADSSNALQVRNFSLPRECKIALDQILKFEPLLNILKLLLEDCVPFRIWKNDNWRKAWIDLHKDQIGEESIKAWEASFKVIIGKGKEMKIPPCVWDDCPPVKNYPIKLRK